MIRQQTEYRTYKVKKDVNLNRLAAIQKQKIQAQRKQFRLKVKKQQARTEARARTKGDNKLQTKLTTRQNTRNQKTIKRNIAKKRKLKYLQHGGDIAFRDQLNNISPEVWQTNFFSSNVWKYKIRGQNLMVGFLDGSIYLYFSAAKLFIGMTRAGSKGKYIWKHFRRAGISFTKIK